MKRLLSAIAAAAFAVAAAPVAAQAWPVKPVRIIVPFPPGQATDTFIRMLAAHLADSHKQQFIVDNRPGGGAVIGMELAARAPADGYTFAAGSSGPMAVNPAVFRKLPYDPIKSFEPVSLLVMVPLIIVTHPSLPVKNLQEMVALAKKRPGQLNVAVAGTATSQHLTAELFKSRAGINVEHIQYKGSGPALADVLGGQVTIFFDSITSSLAHINSGKLRAMAVTGGKRFPTLPNVPTVRETKVADIDMAGWAGLVAPAGTPADIVNRMNAETVKFFARPDIAKRVIDMGSEPAAGTPQQYADFIRTEIAKWSEAAQISGTKLD
jgi:tripartite-type tricarboxylate transporter receptor subunit TctC